MVGSFKERNHFKGNVCYCTEPVLLGPLLLRGKGFSRFAQYQGIKFTFRNSHKDTNGTRVASWRFPCFLFHLMPPIHTKKAVVETK